MLVAIDTEKRTPVNLVVTEDCLHVRLPPEQLQQLAEMIGACIAGALVQAGVTKAP